MLIIFSRVAATASIILCIISAAVHAENNPSAIKAVQGSGRSIYKIENGKKYHIPDWGTFISLGFSGKEIKTISDEELNSYADGGTVEVIKEEPRAVPEEWTHCPCKTSSTVDITTADKYQSEISRQHVLCLVDNEASRGVVNSLPQLSKIVNYRMIAVDNITTDSLLDKISGVSIEGCDAVIKLLPTEELQQQNASSVSTVQKIAGGLCPGTCNAVPYAEIALSHIKEPYVLHRAITCSLTLGAIFESSLRLRSYLAAHKVVGDLPVSPPPVPVSATAGAPGASPHHAAGPTIINKDAVIGHILRAIAIRRIEECNEKGYWPRGHWSNTKLDHRSVESASSNVTLTASSSSVASDTTTTSMTTATADTEQQQRTGHSHQRPRKKQREDQAYSMPAFSSAHSYLYPQESAFPRRAVFGLVIWIASAARMTVAKNQYEVLRGQALTGGNDSYTIVGWLASESEYRCRRGSTICEQKMHNNEYHPAMPVTQLNVANAGWSCAQRRPLRTVAHTLLLYDPQWLLIVDDDTFVNIKMLYRGSPLTTMINTNKDTPIVLGQMTEGKKITNRGFYYGGAGYLLNTGVLRRLNSYHLSGPTVASDHFRRGDQMAKLALLPDVLAPSETHCNECVNMNDGKKYTRVNRDSIHLGLSANTSVRLVELCMNVLAEEKTCYHSDHSLTRCFAHAVYAQMWNLRCWGVTLSKNPPLTVGMCMGVDACNMDIALTCHRWQPDISHPDLTPISLEQGNSSIIYSALRQNVSMAGRVRLLL